MSLDRDYKLDLRDCEVGDRVTMGLNAHDFEKYGTCLTGEIVHLPRESMIEMLYDGRRPMADVKVKGDNGVVWNWNMDNGYVHGPVDDPDRPDRSDIGKIGGIFSPEARDDFAKEHDAGIDN